MKLISHTNGGLIRLIVSFAVIAGLADFCCAADLAYDSAVRRPADNGLQLFDTVTSYESPLSSYQIENKRGWKPIPHQNGTQRRVFLVRDEDISGDICVENDRMAVILRRNSPGPEAYYKIGTRAVKAMTLYLLGPDNDPAINIESFKVISCDETHVLLNALFRTKSEKTLFLEYLIRPGQATIEIRPGKDAKKIIMQAESKYTIMPDLFADDLVIELEKVKSNRFYFPEDNHLLLQMIDDGDAIIVCNWPSSDGEVVVALSNNNGKKPVTETIISFQNNSKIWITLMAQKGIWHWAHTSRLNIYKHTPLSWAVPYPAYWRIDYRRTDSRAFGFTDSFWNAEIQNDGAFKLVPNLLDMDIINGRYIIAGSQEEKRLVRSSVVNKYTGSGWWSYRGWFIQPFFIDGPPLGGKPNSAFIKIPKFDGCRTIRYAGPIVIYPLLRVDAPVLRSSAAAKDEAYADSETVEDVLRNTFGPTYLSILDWADLNRRPEKDRFPPTCTTTKYCEKIFGRNEEIYRRGQIATILGEMNLFVRYTRERLQEYLDWEKEMQVLYQESHQANPNLADAIRMTKSITREIQRRFLREREKIKTPEQAAALSVEVVKLIARPGPFKLRIYDQICSQIRSIGKAQDELLGEYRDIVKITRQKVSLLHTQETDPDARAFLRLVRAQTQKILRIRYDMEGK